MDAYIYKPIENEKRVKITLPGEIVKNKPYYFRNDSEIKEAITRFIIPNTYSIYTAPNANGLPFNTYVDKQPNIDNRPLGTDSLKFYICLAEAGKDNNFLFWNMPISAFANGQLSPVEGQQSLPIEVNAKIDLGKSYIFCPQNLTFTEESKKTFNLLLRYTKN